MAACSSVANVEANLERGKGNKDRLRHAPRPVLRFPRGLIDSSFCIFDFRWDVKPN